MWERSWRAEAVCDAPPEVVWAVLVDFAAYPRWNPFTVAVETSGRLGDPVRMSVRLGGRKPRTQVETLVAWDAPRRLAWALDTMPRWLLWARRDQTLEPLDGGRTRYVTVDVIGGALQPLVAMQYARALEDGFRTMADALSVEVARRVAGASP